MNDQIHLHFRGPYPLCSQEEDVLAGCPSAGENGIYIWAVRAPSGIFRVIYVGETGTSFYRRTKEHLIQILGGNYLVYDPQALRKGQRKDLWPGMWRKEVRDKMPEFLNRYEELAPKIRESLLLHSVFLAPMKSDRALRQSVESAIAWSIRENATDATLFPEDIFFLKDPRTDAGDVLVDISSQEEIEGLPASVRLLSPA